MLNEILTLIFYIIIMFPYVSTIQLTQYQIAVYCIRIILTALIVNLLCNFALTTKKVVQWIKKRKENIKRKTVILPEESHNTSSIETKAEIKFRPRFPKTI